MDPDTFQPFNKDKDDEDDVRDAQLWWDLGIIVYELATGGCTPWYHKNHKVYKKLLHKYPVAFPVNLEIELSEELKQLIRELLMKDKYQRLGYSDQGGVIDIQQSPFMKA